MRKWSCLINNFSWGANTFTCVIHTDPSCIYFRCLITISFLLFKIKIKVFQKRYYLIQLTSVLNFMATLASLFYLTLANVYFFWFLSHVLKRDDLDKVTFVYALNTFLGFLSTVFSLAIFVKLQMKFLPRVNNIRVTV